MRYVREGAVALAASLAALSTGTCYAQAERGIAWDVTGGVQHRELREHAMAGRPPVTESGPMARLQITGRPLGATWRGFEGHVALAHGRLEYDGRSQAGAPLSTHTRHTDAEAGVSWSAWEAQRWGQLRIGADWLQNRRAIAATPTVAGLVERSSWLMPGVTWRSPEFGAAGLTFGAQARWRASVYQRLDVDYSGVFDESSLDAGRRQEAALAVSARAPGTPWTWSFEWRHAWQKASEVSPLYRGGAPVGTVVQPELRVRDLGVYLTRSF